MKRLFKFFAYSLLLLIVVLLATFAYIKWGLAPETPTPDDLSVLQLNRIKFGNNFYRIGNNWLRKTDNGLWEEYIEGAPFERGVVTGKLEKELLYTQEEAFVEQIHKLIPNNTYLSFLGLFTRVFNRHLEENIPEENKLEIYGESFSAPDEFNYISPAYDRMLNYHAAHDIGHALQSLALVGCSSFAVWGERSSDSSMLIGRNLDFYLGDKFSNDKIVYFCNPQQGHKFAMVTWAGFMGCVSGMNDKGLTVTINAAKSDVPTASAMPISLLAREILQYAGNIKEAYAIAKKRKTFVCETLMIGSAKDHKTALIEKSVSKTVLFQSDTNFILCTNHYQSDSFANDKDNLDNKANSSSFYRYLRLQELLNRQPEVSPLTISSILRNQQGLQDKNIGTGNEKALNQLIAHHAVIFQPEKLRFWVSANPYQLGEFVCYDLNKVFAEAPLLKDGLPLHEQDQTIPSDTFLLSREWKNFIEWRELKLRIKAAGDAEKTLANEKALTEHFVSLNPELWETYLLLGDYYKKTGKPQLAVQHYKMALNKEVNDKHETEKLKDELKKLGINFQK